jgi:hypothetical protein
MAGPQGPQGPNGDRGPKGPKGDQGAAGQSAPATPASTGDGPATPTSGGSSIEDGTWQVGSDVQPGTYRAPGGGGCYWEIDNGPPSSSGNTSNVLNNSFGDSNPVVTLSPGNWFKTSNCGTWH